MGESEKLDRLRSKLRHNLNRHKRKKLTGRGKFTLLADDVHEKHSKRLFKRFDTKWGWLSKAKEQDRLRFVTILHDTVPCNVEDIEASISSMRDRLKGTLDRVRGIHFVGAVEVEIVNLETLRDIANIRDENENRKLQVLEEMSTRHQKLFDRHNVVALVHLHGVADLGPLVCQEKEAKDAVAREGTQVRGGSGEYRVEVKRTFSEYADGRKVPIRKNLEGMANYMVKGGNEDLRYQARFGRDILGGSAVAADVLDRKMKKGAGNARYKRNALVEDSLSLTLVGDRSSRNRRGWDDGDW